MVSILDEFDVPYLEEYINTYVDDYITGTLVQSIDNRLITGSRGRVFSKFSAHSTAMLSDSGADVTLTDSKSFRTQPWFERVGSPRFTSHIDSTERYWDSMVPSLTDCFKADNTTVGFCTGTNFFGSTSIITGSTTGATADIYGFVFFDNNITAFANGMSAPSIINNNWTWAYPYEPRYARATRARYIQQVYVSLLQFAPNFDASHTTEQGGQLLYGTKPRIVRGFYFGPTIGSASYSWVSDTILTTNSLGITTRSAGDVDFIKAMYGFGDENSIAYFSGSTTVRVGTNHFASARNSESVRVSTSNGVYYNKFRCGQLIRGWKYGVINGLPEYSKAYFRRNRYGQVRDMLEQRPFTKFYSIVSTGPTSQSPADPRTLGAVPPPPDRASINTLGPSVVEIKFIDVKGNTTVPENTQSQNLSFEATSSLPYFDGEARNRPTFNINVANTGIVSLGGNLSL